MQYAIRNVQYVPVDISKGLVTRLEANNNTLQVRQLLTLMDRPRGLELGLIWSRPTDINRVYKAKDLVQNLGSATITQLLSSAPLAM